MYMQFCLKQLRSGMWTLMLVTASVIVYIVSLFELMLTGSGKSHEMMFSNPNASCMEYLPTLTLRKSPLNAAKCTIHGERGWIKVFANLLLFWKKDFFFKMMGIPSARKIISEHFRVRGLEWVVGLVWVNFWYCVGRHVQFSMTFCG